MYSTVFGEGIGRIVPAERAVVHAKALAPVIAARLGRAKASHGAAGGFG